MRRVSSFSTLYRVDAIEGASRGGRSPVSRPSFSTLYRVDAIEGLLGRLLSQHDALFQYPLSGRCY